MEFAWQHVAVVNGRRIACLPFVVMNLGGLFYLTLSRASLVRVPYFPHNYFINEYIYIYYLKFFIFIKCKTVTIE